jgi:hypothetical protein
MTVLELHGVVGGGLCTYISHRICWMLCEGHLVRRSSSATAGAGEGLQGPLEFGSVWSKSRRQGEIG